MTITDSDKDKAREIVWKKFLAVNASYYALADFIATAIAAERERADRYKVTLDWLSGNVASAAVFNCDHAPDCDWACNRCITKAIQAEVDRALEKGNA